MEKFICTSNIPGIFDVHAYVYDKAGNVGYSKKEVRFIETGVDVPLVAFIDSPEDHSKINGPVEITGTVKSEKLARYKLEYSIKGANNFIEFARGSESVENGVLGTIDTDDDEKWIL